MLLRPDSVTGLLPPLAVIAIPLVKHRLGILLAFPIFYSILCPHQALVPSILLHFPSRGNFPFPSINFSFFFSYDSFILVRFLKSIFSLPSI
ncbi:hypothetical protein Goari_002038, partial [Gossypium aridum]|nr:hypothetical protein [Gossypium aridum]